MKPQYSVLIIDDHPLISAAYKSALDYLSSVDKKLNFVTDVANTCSKAYKKILKASEEEVIDLIFLDIKLPPSKDGKILSGEDLGLIINELLPDSKIIISTTFNDNYRVHSIFKNINPDGFLIKNDINPKELVTAIKTVLKDPPYYTKTVIKLLRKQVSNKLVLDKIDRKLLYELSIGTKTKDLPGILPLSIAGVERRKRHLKEELIQDYIRDIPDFPKQGIVFKDITPLLAHADAMKACSDALYHLIKDKNIDKVIGIEARGFFFATLLAQKLNAGFVPVRKPHKLPFKTLSETYALEYGADTLEMHADAIKKGERVLIHDDVLATGGTAQAACKLVEKQGGIIVQCNFLIALEFLNGKAKIAQYPIASLIQY